MNVFWVFAHPESRSFNGSLKDFSLDVLARAGHAIEISDLYAMRWKAHADADDFPQRPREERLDYMAASHHAFHSGTQSNDVVEEQRKLLWADLVVMQFPLWWFSMPAILKGWIDRTFASGFAYGLSDPHMPKRSRRYGDGGLQGRRAMLVVTASGRESALGPRGVGGHIDDLLFPIQHGILWYTGMSVLPPIVIYNVGHGRMSTDRYNALTIAIETRLLALEKVEPIQFRYQNRGDYDDDLALRPGLEGDMQGFAMHRRAPDQQPATIRKNSRG